MFADLSDARCYYELHGSGDPLVIVPGLGSTGALWMPLAAALGKSFCVILPDNRGVGRSIPKRGPNTLEDFATDLVELLNHLQLPRAHVMGHSLGGVIAHQFAVDHPSRVDRLVLLSCTNRFSPYLREMAGLLARALHHLPRDLYLRMVELLGSAPEYLDRHDDHIARKIAAVCEDPVPSSAITRQLCCLAAHDRDDDLCARVTVPTLVIAGEQDRLIPARYAQRMAEEIPGSEFLLLPGCGHNPFEEQPDCVLSRITDFLMHSRPRSDPGHRPSLRGIEATV